MSEKKSFAVLGLFTFVFVLLPFSRYAELPILILCIIGIHGLIFYRESFKDSEQLKILSIVFACYFSMALISSFDSYWQEKTLIVAISSIRFYLAAIAVLIHLQTKHFKLLIKVIAILIVFWSFDALLQYFIGVDVIGRASYPGRLNGIFGEHHAKLGPVLALLLPIVMISLKQYRTLVRWLCILAIIIAIILSGTRSAWIMMVFILLAYWFHHVKQRRFQLMIKAMLIAGVLIGSLWFFSADFQQRVQRSLSAFDGTYAGLNFALADRLPIWRTSWQMIQQHPINGIGAHAFRKAYPEFASANDIWQQQGGVGMHAHHWVLEVLAETGIIGFLIMLIAIIKLLKFVRKHYHYDYSWAFMIALIAAFLPLTSTYSIFASFWSICIWFCGVGLIVVSRKND